MKAGGADGASADSVVMAAAVYVCGGVSSKSRRARTSAELTRKRHLRRRFAEKTRKKRGREDISGDVRLHEIGPFCTCAIICPRLCLYGWQDVIKRVWRCNERGDDVSIKNNIFMIHSWEESQTYLQMIRLLKKGSSKISDYSVPPWKAVEGSDTVIKESINSRISTATAVVVLNTPKLHKRPMSNYEMEVAVAMGKRIVVLQPHKNFWQPIPAILDDHLYRVAPWRSDVLGQAIRGEYPQDGRVFDIAEETERRAVVKTICLAGSIISIALIIKSATAFKKLAKDLEKEGVKLDFTKTGAKVLKFAAGGALVASTLAAILTRDTEAASSAAIAGGLVGAAFGGYRVYRAALNGTSHLRILSITPS